MAVAHGEEVQPQLIEHVWHQNVRVLVLLVRIAWLVSDRGRVRKLGDAVEPLARYVGLQVLAVGMRSHLAVDLVRVAIGVHVHLVDLRWVVDSGERRGLAEWPRWHRVAPLLLYIIHFLIVFKYVWVEFVTAWVLRQLIVAVAPHVQRARPVHDDVVVLFLTIIYFVRLGRDVVVARLGQWLDHVAVRILIEALANNDLVSSASLTLRRHDVMLLARQGHVSLVSRRQFLCCLRFF